MKRSSAVVAGCVTATAAVAGNAFIGRDAMAWFGDLNKPQWQLPMPGFIVVGTTYYGIVGYVLARAIDRGDAETVRWAGTVLVANEAWNALLFGRRSPSTAFAGLFGFLVPLAFLQRSVWSDKRSRATLLPYTAWVIAYDLPWSYRLWRLNTLSAR
ncbi:TspO/MBR family protein [Lapillicoccus sp.]|uniref:TspO/MBR family protein n=1 Tax=Lapillicoccus sp. TaxID=1909287 RepID=UPI003265AC1D